MTNHKVTVWGEAHTVQTDQLSKSVWRASGKYMGEYHQTQDRTEGAAIKRWREWAEYKGN